MFNFKKLLILGSAISVTGCSGSDYLFSEDVPVEQKPQTQTQNAGTQAMPVEAFVSDTTVSLNNPAASTPSVVSDSFVTQKINTLKNELHQLKTSVANKTADLRNVKEKMALDSKKYYEVVAEISSRLQIGTTPGNPILNSKWRDATIMLDTVSQDVTAMSNLASQITADTGMTTYLLDSVRASYNISGAVDEDHSQLKILEDEIIQTAVQSERLLSDVNVDIARQHQYIENEKKNLASLAVAIRDGQLYSANNGMPMTQKYRAPMVSEVAEAVAPIAKKPMVAIRFSRDNIEYEQPLYVAMQKALDKKQDISFEVAGLGKTQTEAKKYVDKVVRSMMNMGVPVNRIRTTTSTNTNASTPEVKIFVR